MPTYNVDTLAERIEELEAQIAAKDAALEEAARIADRHGWCGGGAVICGPEIAAATRALATPATGGAK